MSPVSQINLEQFLGSSSAVKQSLEQTTGQLFFIPFMTPDKFAEAIGLSKGVAGGWIDQGYLPTAKIGR